MGTGDGGRADFEEVFEREFSRLLGVASVITGDRGRAREIVQETFARALVRWERIADFDDPPAWLMTVTVRQAVRVRDRGRREVLADDAGERAGPGGATDAEVENRLVVAGLLAGLSAQQRAAVTLHYLEGLPVREVAALLRVREGTVKTHLARARQQMAAALAGDETTGMAR